MMQQLEQKLRERAHALLAQQQVRYLIGWGKTRFGEKTRPLFIERPEQAGQLLFNEHCLNSLGKYALDIAFDEGKIAICTRGCEARAINRLIADKRLRREQVYLLGLPCPGMAAEKCALCTEHNPVVYDELLGTPLPQDKPANRFAAVEELEAQSAEARYGHWSSAFARCIRCYACRNVCPACNCLECYTDQYRTGWQGKQNNLAENMVYGLTRAYHIGDRCIECGECQRVCPMDLPLMQLNRKLVKDVNELFGEFDGGLDAATEPALGKFRKDDLEEFM